jgi:hypothetical protein
MAQHVKVNIFFANLGSDTVELYRKILLEEELNKRVSEQNDLEWTFHPHDWVENREMEIFEDKLREESWEIITKKKNLEIRLWQEVKARIKIQRERRRQ